MLGALKQLNDRGAGFEAFRTDELIGSSDVLVARWEREFPSGVDIDAFTPVIGPGRLAMLPDEGLAKRGEAAGVKLTRCCCFLKMHGVTSGTGTCRIDQRMEQDLAEGIPDPRRRARRPDPHDPTRPGRGLGRRLSKTRRERRTKPAPRRSG